MLTVSQIKIAMTEVQLISLKAQLAAAVNGRSYSALNGMSKSYTAQITVLEAGIKALEDHRTYLSGGGMG